MPRLEFAAPCLLTSIDQRSNALSVFNIVESLEVAQRPNETAAEAWNRALPSLEVVTLWRRLESDVSAAEYEQSITIQTPGASECEVSRVRFRIPHFRHRVQVQLPPMEGATNGQLILRVYLHDLGKEADVPVFDYPIGVDITILPIVITLTDDEMEYLEKPVSGQGGFQSLLRRIQSQIAGNKLSLSVSDGERLLRYARDYGGGGFQARLGRIVEHVRQQLD